MFMADGTLTIIAGTTSGSIIIDSIADDSLDERKSRLVIITLSNPNVMQLW